MPRFPRFSVSPGHYLFWRDHATAGLRGSAAWGTQNTILDTGADDPQRVRADRVTADLFPLLGVCTPHAGRLFEPGRTRGWRHGDGGVAVVCNLAAALRRRPGRDRSDDQAQPAAGARSSASCPQASRLPSRETEMSVPMAMSAAEKRTFGSHFMGAVARLKPGVTREAAMADIAARLEGARPSSTSGNSEGWEVLSFFDLHDYTVDDVRAVVAGAAGSGGAGDADRLRQRRQPAARARRRHGTRSWRSASSIGATRGRLLRQLIVEQVTLATGERGGGRAARRLAAARVAVDHAQRAAGCTPTSARSRLVMTFALAAGGPDAIVVRAAAGHPGLSTRSARLDVRPAGAAGGWHCRAPYPHGALVVVNEIALAMTLLVGAGLLVRSFVELTDQSPGFDPQGAVLAGISLPTDKYPQGEVRERFLGEFLGPGARRRACERWGWGWRCRC